MQQKLYWFGSLFLYAFLLGNCISNEHVSNERVCRSDEKKIPRLIYND